MIKRTWFKAGLGASAVALIASAGMAIASPVLAQTGVIPGAAPSAQMAPLAPLQRGGKGGGMQWATVAKALGITEAELQTELQTGKTIAAIATAKGVDLTTVSAALLEAEKTTLAQAVTDGKLTQAQADERLANAQTRITGMLNGTTPQGLGGRGGPRGGMAGGPQFSVIATALGIDEAALKTELQAGKTIADVAKAKNIDLTVVSNAVLAAEKTKLAQAVTDGKLTQAQADERLANAQTRLTDLLNGKLPQGPGKGGPGGPGMRGPKPGATPAPSTTSTGADL